MYCEYFLPICGLPFHFLKGVFFFINLEVFLIPVFKKKFIYVCMYIFIYFHQVLVVAGGFLSCGMQTLSCSMHVGSSSLTRD